MHCKKSLGVEKNFIFVIRKSYSLWGLFICKEREIKYTERGKEKIFKK